MSADHVSHLTRDQFQAELDALSDGSELELHEFEYPGPVIIRRNSVVIDGCGATLWSMQGPVCRITGRSVTLKNMKLEVTQEDQTSGDAEEGCALHVEGGHGILLDNVEVRGSVQGLPVEEGQWRYPISIKLDELGHGHEYRFLLRLYVPVPCRITSAVHGISAKPAMLNPGRNEVTLAVECAARNVLLLGTLCLQTAFLRRQISICGHVVGTADSGVARQDGEVLYEPPDWNDLGSVQPQAAEALPVQKPSVPQPPPPPPTPPPRRSSTPVEPERPISSIGGPPPSDRRSLGRSQPPGAVHRSVPLSPLFNQPAPPPVFTEAGPVESGTRIPAVFGSAGGLLDTAKGIERSTGVDDADTSAREPPAPDRVGAPDSASPPTLSPTGRSLGARRRTTSGDAHSMPLGEVFGMDTKKASNVDTDAAKTSTPASPAERPPAPSKKCPSKESRSVPGVFFQ